MVQMYSLFSQCCIEKKKFRYAHLEMEIRNSQKCFVTQGVIQLAKKWNQVHKSQSIQDVFKFILNSLTQVSGY